MTSREFVLLVLFCLAVLGGVLDRQLALRLEWVNFGRTYEAQQQQVIQAINQIGQDVQRLKQGAQPQQPVPQGDPFAE